ncbi:hypothetical protein [Caballeronia sp. LZ032]|uniref:hypothetical protein n=1 Tax=Caballeronia sp. LZ032 TaxID=3038565 RepID=UPI002865FB75|nr:hypothetical protein [Caballeronia sp. LZ032]MDR5881142.1 hypothetical protein [Caballeronia sp. LZ032]
MERIFMTRRRALSRLLQLQRELRKEAQGRRVVEVEGRLDQSDVIEQLLMDVRACRIHSFQLAGPPRVEVFITE